MIPNCVACLELWHQIPRRHGNLQIYYHTKNISNQIQCGSCLGGDNACFGHLAALAEILLVVCRLAWSCGCDWLGRFKVMQGHWFHVESYKMCKINFDTSWLGSVVPWNLSEVLYSNTTVQSTASNLKIDNQHSFRRKEKDDFGKVFIQWSCTSLRSMESIFVYRLFSHLNITNTVSTALHCSPLGVQVNPKARARIIAHVVTPRPRCFDSCKKMRESLSKGNRGKQRNKLLLMPWCCV